jgi:hypothetical protein
MPSIEIERDAVPEWVVRETGQILIIIDHAGTEYFSQISTLEKKREISDVYFDGELSFTVSSYRFVAHVAHDAIYGCRCISPDPAPEFVVRRAEWFRREFIRLVTAHARRLDDRIESTGWTVDRDELNGYSFTKGGYRIFIPFEEASVSDCRFYLDT